MDKKHGKLIITKEKWNQLINEEINNSNNYKLIFIDNIKELYNNSNKQLLNILYLIKLNNITNKENNKYLINLYHKFKNKPKLGTFNPYQKDQNFLI